MIVKCEGCSTRFRIADEKVTPKGVKVRCTKCKATFVVRSGDGVPDPKGAQKPATPRPGAQKKPSGSGPGAGRSPPPPLGKPLASAPPAEDSPSPRPAPPLPAPPLPAPPLPAQPLIDDSEVIGSAPSDPLSLIQNKTEEAASFDLDSLLGKDFDLDLPAGPDESDKSAATSTAQGEPSGIEAEPKSGSRLDVFGLDVEEAPPPPPPPPSEAFLGEQADPSPPAPPAEAYLGEEAAPPPPAEALLGVEAEQPQPVVPESPFASPLGDPGLAEGEEDPFDSVLDKLGPDPSPSEKAGAETSGVEKSEDLSSSLFEGVDLGETGSSGSEGRALTELFDGDIDREDMPSPTEEDVDTALAAFDSAFDVDVDDADAGSEAVPEEVGAAASEQASPKSSETSQPAQASVENSEASQPVQAEAGSSGSWQGMPGPSEDHAEEGWAEAGAEVELDEAPGQGQGQEKGEEEDALRSLALDQGDSSPAEESDVGELQLDFGSEPSPGQSGVEEAKDGPEDPFAGGPEDFSFNLDSEPGMALGAEESGAAAGSSGPAADLNLDALPPLNLDDAPSVSLGKAEASDSGLTFDAGEDDPFAGMDSGEGGGDFFGSLDDLSGGGDDDGLGPAQPEPVPAPAASEAQAIARIDLAAKQGTPSESVAQPGAAKTPGRRLPIVAVMANGLFAFALMAVAVLAFVVFRTGGPIDASLLSAERVREAFAARVDAGPKLRVISTGTYRSRAGTRLVVVRGQVENQTDAAITSLNVEGRLVGRDGSTLRTAPAVFGEMPSSEDLWRISGTADMERLLRPRADPRGTLEPGANLDFFILFEGEESATSTPRFEVALVDGDS